MISYHRLVVVYNCPLLVPVCTLQSYFMSIEQKVKDETMLFVWTNLLEWYALQQRLYLFIYISFYLKYLSLSKMNQKQARCWVKVNWSRQKELIGQDCKPGMGMCKPVMWSLVFIDIPSPILLQILLYSEKSCHLRLIINLFCKLLLCTI